MERSCGILMHISSLPNRFGIGSLGKEAFAYVDFLALAGQRYWQLLPMGPTGYGDSPYQLFSSWAGNPYFIDLDLLMEEGLLSEEEVEPHLCMEQGAVDYGRLHAQRFALLRQAFLRGKERDKAEQASFAQINGDWLEDYALFVALRQQHADRIQGDGKTGSDRRPGHAQQTIRHSQGDEGDVGHNDQANFWVMLNLFPDFQGIFSCQSA
ncbi:MAG: hypothetical protein EOM66_06340 [Clostridia bacterium]|nr:hypothetical protein [Clostridia bacterium]